MPTFHRLSIVTSLLFVYGTLRRGFSNPHASLLRSKAEWLGAGRMRGRLFLLGTLPVSGELYPGAVHEPDGQHEVVGDVFRLIDSGAVLADLDHYEGVGPEFPEPQEYVRKMVPVLVGGVEMQCWCYLCQRSLEGLTAIASGDFADRASAP